jgi:excisionase family DNA binding protein
MSTAQARRLVLAIPREFEFSVLVMEKRMPAPYQRRSGTALPKFYSIKTIAETLEVSTRTVRRWIARGDLIMHRVNGNPPFPERTPRCVTSSSAHWPIRLKPSLTC